MAERYYTIDDIEALPDGQRAELIDGQIFMMTFSQKDASENQWENPSGHQ